MSLIRRWRERRQKAREHDTALALMVYETWLLSGRMPKPSLQRWCEKQLNRRLFD